MKQKRIIKNFENEKKIRKINEKENVNIKKTQLDLLKEKEKREKDNA